MGLHVLGQKCPNCGRKGLVLGATDDASFRPQGWLLQRLPARTAACPHCGTVVSALLPEALKTLRETLRSERLTEKVTYHARPRRKKKPPPSDASTD